LPTQVVDGLEAPGGDQPGTRVVRHTALRPLLDRTAKRLVQRLLGQVEITQQADQGGEHAARLLAVKALDQLGDRWRYRHALLLNERIRCPILPAASSSGTIRPSIWHPSHWQPFGRWA
jgi:hypothetical protein